MKIGVKGERSRGVMDCAEFLREVSLGKEVEVGDKVAVIGGGNAAIDAARTALRLGAKEVNIVYRRTRVEMPANPEEVEEAVAEGVSIDYLVAPSRIKGHNGWVELESLRMELGEMDSSGRRRPEPIEGSQFTTSYDTIIAAIGQRPEVPEGFNMSLGRGNIIEVDPDTLATSRDGVYAGGDAASGPASVIEAIAAGRQAAISIDKYLGGKGEIEETLAPPEGEIAPLEEAEEQWRPKMPAVPVKKRLGNFGQVELGYDDKAAIEEAKRCLRCDLEERE